MTNGRASVLIVCRKGSLRDGLKALLDAMPRVGVVDTADTLDEALRANDPEQSPALIVLDARSVGPDTWLAVRRAKARWRGGRFIVLADTVDQQREAEAAGADAVLINGFLPARLDATLVRLLPHSADEEDIPVSVRNRGGHSPRPREVQGRASARGRPRDVISGSDPAERTLDG